MSFDMMKIINNAYEFLSQSLWNRAMSFDLQNRATMTTQTSLNPFETGQCLSTNGEIGQKEKGKGSQSLWNRTMSFDCNYPK